MKDFMMMELMVAFHVELNAPPVIVNILATIVLETESIHQNVHVHISITMSVMPNVKNAMINVKNVIKMEIVLFVLLTENKPQNVSVLNIISKLWLKVK